MFDLAANGIDGFPDGMTIDVEGKLWVAVYGGAKVKTLCPQSVLPPPPRGTLTLRSRSAHAHEHVLQVLRVNPDNGTLMTTVAIPAPEVTSVAFGGANLDELYVTTAAMRMTKELREKFPDAGALFRVTGLGVRGYPGRAARL